ncbi:MAG: hypothetical protein IAI49_04920 [Candidatus Eremiobacteraeota bacterium]|nr:hypothetical protein [Candidatus Eremiobacteraeota bacterium]
METFAPVLAFAGAFATGLAFALACFDADAFAATVALASAAYCGTEFIRRLDFTLVR